VNVVEEVNGPAFLAIGYGLAVVLYGGYWLFLNRRTAKLRATLASLTSK